jgi:AraC-like DNA-binding protein
MEKYDLSDNDLSKLHFEIKPLAPYYYRHKEKASRAHRHSFFQILWFKESGKHYIDFEVVKHPANSVFLINKNQVHHFCTKSSNEGLLFHFNDALISNLSIDLLSRFTISIFSEIGDTFIKLSIKESVSFENTSLELLSEITEKKGNYSHIAIHQFIGLLYQIERIKKEQSSFVITSDFSKLVKFKQLIIYNIDQQLSIQEFAKQLGVTSKKLTSLSKKHTSLTPASLIKELKLLEAKRMLSNQNISIKEVAYSLGFNQPTYFTKFFKKDTKITPKQFQEQLR